MADNKIPRFHVPDPEKFVASCEQLVPLLEEIASDLALPVSNAAGRVEDDTDLWRQRRQLIRAAMDTLAAVDDAARVLTALGHTVTLWRPWLDARANQPVPEEVMNTASDKFWQQFLPSFTALITGYRSRLVQPTAWNVEDAQA